MRQPADKRPRAGRFAARVILLRDASCHAGSYGPAGSRVAWVTVVGMFFAGASSVVAGQVTKTDAAVSHPAASSPLALVPADAAVVYFQVPVEVSDAATGAPSALALAGVVAEFARSTGLYAEVDADLRLWADVLASLPAILQHPFSVVLLDISAAPREGGGHRLAGLRAALIVQTQGDHAALERRIQSLLNIHTNSEDSQLSKRNSGLEADAGGSVFTLTDRRLPSWASISWGPVGDAYAVTIGEGAFERLVDVQAGRTPGLGASDSSSADSRWFRRAFEVTSGARARGGCYVRFDHLRRTDDALLTAKVRRVEASLGLGSASRGLFTVRYDDRAVEIDGVVRMGDRDVRRPITDSALLQKVGLRSVPDEATHFAVVDGDPAALLDAFGAAYLAARSTAGRASTLSFWRELEAQAGVSIHDDILSRLDRYPVIHNHPPHPLGFPLMWTIQARIKGDPVELREKIDQLLTHVRETLAGDGTIRLIRETDGLWYLSLGIPGPAIAVVDSTLLISFSPYALRMNAARLTAKPKPELHDGTDDDGAE